jgi:hypothetical protein
LAAVDGDFIMTAAEVQPVLRALRKGGIHVVAQHNHMASSDTRLVTGSPSGRIAPDLRWWWRRAGSSTVSAAALPACLTSVV